MSNVFVGKFRTLHLQTQAKVMDRLLKISRTISRIVDQSIQTWIFGISKIFNSNVNLHLMQLKLLQGIIYFKCWLLFTASFKMAF